MIRGFKRIKIFPMHRHFPLMARMGVYFGRKDTVLEKVIQSTIGDFKCQNLCNSKLENS